MRWNEKRWSIYLGFLLWSGEVLNLFSPDVSLLDRTLSLKFPLAAAGAASAQHFSKFWIMSHGKKQHDDLIFHGQMWKVDWGCFASDVPQLTHALNWSEMSHLMVYSFLCFILFCHPSTWSSALSAPACTDLPGATLVKNNTGFNYAGQHLTAWPKPLVLLEISCLCVLQLPDGKQNISTVQPWNRVPSTGGRRFLWKRWCVGALICSLCDFRLTEQPSYFICGELSSLGILIFCSNILNKYVFLAFCCEKCLNAAACRPYFKLQR